MIYWCHVKMQVIHLSANKIKYGLVCWWIYSRVRMMKAWAGGRPALSNPTSSPLYKMKNNIIILTVGYSHCFTFPYEYSMSLFWKIFLHTVSISRSYLCSESQFADSSSGASPDSVREGSVLTASSPIAWRASFIWSALCASDPRPSLWRDPW